MQALEPQKGQEGEINSIPGTTLTISRPSPPYFCRGPLLTL